MYDYREINSFVYSVVCMIIGVAIALSMLISIGSYTCKQKVAFTGYDYKFDLITGCFVNIDNTFVPVEALGYPVK